MGTELISSGILNRRIGYWIFTTIVTAKEWWQCLTSASLHYYIVGCYIWQLGSNDTFACDMIMAWVLQHLQTTTRLCGDSIVPSLFSTMKTVHVDTVTLWIVTWHRFEPKQKLKYESWCHVTRYPDDPEEVLITYSEGDQNENIVIS